MSPHIEKHINLYVIFANLSLGKTNQNLSQNHHTLSKITFFVISKGETFKKKKAYAIFI